MKSNFLFCAMLLCSTVMFAQQIPPQQNRNGQPPNMLQRDMIGKYPGGVYTVWDTATKQYRQYSPARGFIQNPYPSVLQHNNNSNVSNAARQKFGLAKDICAATDANPGNNVSGVFKQSYAVLNGIAYFTADDGIHGTELWRSDGTDAGTYLVKDIQTGEYSPYISNITAANGKIYFTVSTSQAWVSDGTEAGTHLLLSTSTSGYPAEKYTAVNNMVYFFANNNEIWKTDGTVAGTVQVISSGNWSQFSQPVAVGNLLFFTAFDYYSGRELYRTDGTLAGTYMVKDLNNNYDDGPQQLTAYNNKLYFSGSDGVNRKLWQSDGTSIGTTLVPFDNGVILPTSYYAQFIDFPFVIANNTLFFTATDQYGNFGTELYKYTVDNANGVELVKDITPGFEGTNFDNYEFTAAGNAVAFKVDNSDGTSSLWSSNGKAAGTKLIKTFPNYGFYNLLYANNSLYMEVVTDANGYEMWKSNGTDAGTVMIKDIFPGTHSSYPSLFSNTPAGILFTARDEAGGYELWKTNGTDAGTQRVKDINQTATSSSYAGNYDITNLTNGVVFVAYDALHGYELFSSKGVPASTKLVSDIYPGEFSSYPHFIKTKNNTAYFWVSNDENYKNAIYKYDGSNAPVKLFEAPEGYLLSYPYAYDVANNGLVFFELYNFITYQYELWRTDGTAAGSYMLIANTPYDSYPVCVGNTCYFSNNDAYYDSELWKTNGTIAGTKEVININPYGSSSPYSLFLWNNELYFGAYDGTYYSFWKTNTDSGAIKLANINPTLYYYGSFRPVNHTYCVSGNSLYISAYDPSGTGTELWKTDGTSPGTVLVKDIETSFYGSSTPDLLTDVNGTLYFTAYTSTYGTELWRSDGTANGTKLVKDIVSGPFGSYPAELTSASGKLFFLSTGGLWVSQGKDANTIAISDAGLNGVSSINTLTPAGDKLFFNGYTYKTGSELYAGYVGSAEPISFAAVSDNAVANTSFSATVSPNPAKSAATLHLSGTIQNADITITDNNGKTIWKQQHVNSSTIQLPVQNLLPGMYYVTVVNGKENKTIKLVKE